MRPSAIAPSPSKKGQGKSGENERLNWLIGLKVLHVQSRAYRPAQWKGQLLEGAVRVFGQDKSEAGGAGVDLKTLHAKIGGLTQNMNLVE